MELRRNPLINGLIPHTFKLNMLFLEKIHSNTFWLDKTFSCWSQVTMMFLKTKKIEFDFQLGTPPAKPAKQKKQIALEKLLRLYTRESPAAAAEAV